jgi:hypothetical protein
MKYTKQEIANCFRESTIPVAEFISKLEEMKNRFSWISAQTMDNADPECCAADCLERLGVLLSALVIYADEYQKDADKENENENKNKKRGNDKN